MKKMKCVYAMAVILVLTTAASVSHADSTTAVQAAIALATGGHLKRSGDRWFPVVEQTKPEVQEAVKEIIPFIERMSDTELLSFIENSKLATMTAERSMDNDYFKGSLYKVTGASSDSKRIKFAHQIGLRESASDSQKIKFVKLLSTVVEGIEYRRNSLDIFGLIELSDYAYLSLADRAQRIWNQPELRAKYFSLITKLSREGVNPPAELKALREYRAFHNNPANNRLDHELDYRPDYIRQGGPSSEFIAASLPDPRQAHLELSDFQMMLKVLASPARNFGSMIPVGQQVDSYFLALQSNDPALADLQDLLKRTHPTSGMKKWTVEQINNERAGIQPSSEATDLALLRSFESGELGKGHYYLFEALVQRTFLRDFSRNNENIKRFIPIASKLSRKAFHPHRPGVVDDLMENAIRNCRLNEVSEWVAIFNEAGAPFGLRHNTEKRANQEISKIMRQIENVELNRTNLNDIAIEKMRLIRSSTPLIEELRQWSPKGVADFHQNFVMKQLKTMPVAIKATAAHGDLVREKGGTWTDNLGSSILQRTIGRTRLGYRSACEQIFHVGQ